MRNPKYVCASNHLVFTPGGLGSRMVIAFFKSTPFFLPFLFSSLCTSQSLHPCCAIITKYLDMYEIPPNFFLLSLCLWCSAGNGGEVTIGHPNYPGPASWESQAFFINDHVSERRIKWSKVIVNGKSSGDDPARNFNYRVEGTSARFYTSSNRMPIENTQRVIYPWRCPSLSHHLPYVWQTAFPFILITNL